MKDVNFYLLIILVSVAGNCRMCLVELKNLDKLILSCSTIVESNMEIITNSIYIKIQNLFYYFIFNKIIVLNKNY